MPDLLFLEDLSPGQRFNSPDRQIDGDTADRFGSDAERASDKHIASMTMRLLVDSDFRPAGGILGAGIEGLRWPTPARPGDRLHVESEILEVRRSNTRPDRGLVRVRNVTLNTADEPVQTMISTCVVRARN